MRRAGPRRAGRGDGAGRRLPALRLPPGLGARAGRLRAQRRARRAARGRGPRDAVDGFLRRLADEAPPLAAIEAVRPRDVAPRGRARLPDRREPARRRAGRARLARHRDLRGLPRRAVRSRRPPLPLSVRQLHELRAALHDRPRRPLRPAADDDGGLRACARAARPSTRTRPTAASTPSRTRARSAGRRCGCCRADALRRRGAARRGRGAARRGGSSRSRASAATTSPACAGERAGGRRAARAQAPRGQAVRAAWSPTSTPRARWSTLTDEEAALLAGRDRPIVLAPRLAGRAGGAVGRAALGRPRRDAALLAAAPPAAGRRRRAARDDERQRLRRADRLRGRRRARAPGRDRRPLALPRPPDPHAHRRLRAARGARPAAAAAAPLARLRARRAGAAGRRAPRRCSPAAPS